MKSTVVVHIDEWIRENRKNARRNDKNYEDLKRLNINYVM